MQLNLARKWRSQTFDEIIGQDLTVRLLKNSLYKRQFFPVYLLSGQRGCGKTSTGRIFAAAANCASYDAFINSPQSVSIPCLICVSCKAMLTGNHPDFIEIDAASNTGVDNVRHIVESATFLPTMGRKKIYLIDEAHMLSKAAFNAFLKVLEEPPASVIFMLATTDTEKIIDTVRSRCFQLFFDPIAPATLHNHLITICTQESIAYESAGLDLIIQETEGSVRDALNMIERIRLIGETVSVKTVSAHLGFIDDATLLTILHYVINNAPEEALRTLAQNNSIKYAPTILWRRLVTLLLALVHSRYGINTTIHTAQLQALAKNITHTRLISCLEVCYSFEAQFIKSSAQHALFELLLLKICQTTEQVEIKKPTVTNTATALIIETKKIDIKKAMLPAWEKFLQSMEQFPEPIVASLFTRSSIKSFDATNGRLEIIFSKNGELFKEWLEKTHTTWQSLLDTAFGMKITCISEFSGESPAQTIKQPVPTALPTQKTQNTTISAHGEKARNLLQLFPGTISELKES